MAYEVETRTGAKYLIDTENGFWQKIDRLGTPLGTERLWALMVGDTMLPPWESAEAWESANVPEVGKHLYIQSKSLWYISTEVTSVTEIEPWMDKD